MISALMAIVAKDRLLVPVAASDRWIWQTDFSVSVRAIPVRRSIASKRTLPDAERARVGRNGARGERRYRRLVVRLKTARATVPHLKSLYGSVVRSGDHRTLELLRGIAGIRDETRTTDAPDSAGLVVFRGIAADPDRAQNIARRVADQHPARHRNDLPA